MFNTHSSVLIIHQRRLLIQFTFNAFSLKSKLLLYLFITALSNHSNKFISIHDLLYLNSLHIFNANESVFGF